MYINIYENDSIYKFEVYGASGGYTGNYITSYRVGSKCPNKLDKNIETNVKCSSLANAAGAGGYTSGILYVPILTTFYIYIGNIGFFNAVKNTTEKTLNSLKFVEWK